MAHISIYCGFMVGENSAFIGFKFPSLLCHSEIGFTKNCILTNFNS